MPGAHRRRWRVLRACCCRGARTGRGRRCCGSCRPGVRGAGGLQDDRHQIVEAKAKNGLCINGEACSEKLLDDGDEIHVGDTVLTYYVSDQTDRTNAVDQYRAAGREFREDQTISESNRQ